MGAVAAGICGVAACMAGWQAVKTHVEVLDPSGAPKAVVTVKVAADEAAREKGLMWVKELPNDGGMWFVWPEAVFGQFWMKNTYVPLDMVFVRDGKVVDVVHDAKPLDETPRGPLMVKFDRVLEMKAGWAAALGVKEGWTLREE